MSRYRQPEPPRRSTARVVGRIILGIAVVLAMLAVALVAGIYLWFHESVAAIRAHSVDVKSAQKEAGPNGRCHRGRCPVRFLASAWSAKRARPENETRPERGAAAAQDTYARAATLATTACSRLAGSA